MVKRYHKKVYFPEDSKEKLKAFINVLNGLDWRYSRHTLDNLKYRDIHLPSVLTFISLLKLDSDNIFEYYTDDNDNIVKVCYRAIYGRNTDVILVISHNKNIVTIYSNIAGDNHLTLKKELYLRG